MLHIKFHLSINEKTNLVPLLSGRTTAKSPYVPHFPLSWTWHGEWTQSTLAIQATPSYEQNLRNIRSGKYIFSEFQLSAKADRVKQAWRRSRDSFWGLGLSLDTVGGASSTVILNWFAWFIRSIHRNCFPNGENLLRPRLERQNGARFHVPFLFLSLSLFVLSPRAPLLISLSPSPSLLARIRKKVVAAPRSHR